MRPRKFSAKCWKHSRNSFRKTICNLQTRATASAFSTTPRHHCFAIDFQIFTNKGLSLNISYFLLSQGDFDDAEPLLLKALGTWERVLGESHKQHTDGLNALGLMLKRQGRFDQADPVYRRALNVLEKQFGPEHPEVANTLNNLGMMLQSRGNNREAEPLLRRALAIREALLGQNHLETANTLNALATLLRDTNRRDEAKPLMLRAFEINLAGLGPDHYVVATWQQYLESLGWIERVAEIQGEGGEEGQSPHDE
eukprot:c17320_g1_i6.p1 GENE.c17320_g1_i6~~c17320_g1_i6.p1  ORF type:complete len:254 (+),score=44.03 c17320_g1_i6:265-1026(+)